MVSVNQLPMPDHYDPARVMEVRRVPYREIARAARDWTLTYSLKAASTDSITVALLAIDCQLTFCHPDFELYVGGRTGTGAIDDTRRLIEFIYSNLHVISAIHPTMDTHTATQIFFDTFYVNAQGNHPVPMVAEMSPKTLQSGAWMVNPAIASRLSTEYADLQHHILHYVRELTHAGKYNLTIWPYHAMLGGIGHALVPALEEACFFHTLARSSQTSFEMKGGNPLTENYSALRPEVLTTVNNRPLAQKNSVLIDKLLQYDRLIVAGQAKSHCVSWTVDDLLSEIDARDHTLASKVYLLEDCTTPVVAPGVLDFTDQADAAYHKFRNAGMHIVRSTDPMTSWPGMFD